MSEQTRVQQHASENSQLMARKGQENDQAKDIVASPSEIANCLPKGLAWDRNPDDAKLTLPPHSTCLTKQSQGAVDGWAKSRKDRANRVTLFLS